MRVLIAGGTGLIGSEVARRLLDRGDMPVILSRDPDSAKKKLGLAGIAMIQGDPNTPGAWQSAVDGCDAVVNLAGQNLFRARWNERTKQKIRDSRVISTQNIVAAIEQGSARPRVLVQGSAIGYYGSRGDEELMESSPPGDDFLARVCVEWEAASRAAEALGVRVPIFRTGLVLARGAGALKMLVPLFRLVPGAPIGSDGRLTLATGKQWQSWIHLTDMTNLILLGIDHPGASGPINATAPNPVRNAEFARSLSRTLWRWYAPWRVSLPYGPPDIFLDILLGKVSEVLTKGQKVMPEHAINLGFSFKYSFINQAIDEVINGRIDELRDD